MDPVRTPRSLEATGASENDVQVVIPVSDEKLVAPTMAGVWNPRSTSRRISIRSLSFSCAYMS